MYTTHAQTYSILWYRYGVHRYWLPRQVWDKPLCGQNENKQIVMTLSINEKITLCYQNKFSQSLLQIERFTQQ